MAVVADTSVLVAFLRGEDVPAIDSAGREGTLIIPPLVVAELVSGPDEKDRAAIGELLQDVPVHPTPLAHWLAVGELRRLLRTHGIAVTIPDAHVAQCAIDSDSLLLTRDAIFARIARVASLHLAE